MAVGFLLIGVLLGTLGAVTALVSGMGVFAAFLVYSGAGAIGMMLSVAIAVLASVKPREPKGRTV